MTNMHLVNDKYAGTESKSHPGSVWSMTKMQFAGLNHNQFINTECDLNPAKYSWV